MLHILNEDEYPSWEQFRDDHSLPQNVHDLTQARSPCGSGAACLRCTSACLRFTSARID